MRLLAGQLPANSRATHSPSGSRRQLPKPDLIDDTDRPNPAAARWTEAGLAVNLTLMTIKGPRRLLREYRERRRPLTYRTGTRYDTLVDELEKLRPSTILEIGVATGDTAERLLRIALTVCAGGDGIRYWGFDLFEDISADLFEVENAKRSRLASQVRSRLEATEINGRRASVEVIKGNTTESLPASRDAIPFCDLIFIDGGHSYETVRSDWSYCLELVHPGSVIFFDDYPRWGVGRLVDGIDRAH